MCFYKSDFTRKMCINHNKNPEKCVILYLTNPYQIIEILSMITGKKILPGETLIIFDEIQECPEALNTLKYFKEKANDYHVIAAGSLLGTLLAKPNYCFL